jgi:hypothetical protein
MTREQRRVVRQGLIDSGFTRTSYSNVDLATGGYSETWANKDGDIVVINWMKGASDA